MERLINLLLEQTSSLKDQYIEKTIEWSSKQFDVIIERSKWNEEKWAEYLGVQTRIANPNTTMQFVTFHSGFYNTKNSRIYKKEKDKIYSAIRLGKDDYISKSVKEATNHYFESIKKLAFRIDKKDLNKELLKLTTSHIGINISTTITDGTKTVNAFTVLAWGEIQCPHYRYLIR